MGSKQLGFGDYEQTTAKKRTRRERFLAEMEKVVPWKALIDQIEPHYPKTSSKGGRPPYPLATMLRIHLLQQWYDLSDPAMEDALIEVPTMRRFAGIDMISDRIPDETTILAFRHLLEKNDLGQQIFEVIKAHLKANGMAMKQGTIIDATLIAAPSSTKNKKKERDPEMHQTCKGKQWYFGMKVHIGVDSESGLICPATIWLRGRAKQVDRSRGSALNPVAMRRAPGHACSPHRSTDCVVHVQTTSRHSPGGGCRCSGSFGEQCPPD
jgi:transposase, IS5 family